jgi:uncharacterized membrane protein YhaH (DUF805 family)
MSRQKRAWAPYAWVVGIVWVLPAIVLQVLRELLPDHNADGQCEGIGFGCTLTPADSVELLGIFIYPVLVVAGLVAIVVVSVLQARRRRDAGSPR